jgi:PAS domain-containing protein
LQNGELQQTNHEREVVQKLLLEEVSSYSRYYELSSEGYITIDNKWSIVKLNLTFCSKLSHNKNDILYRKITDFIYGLAQDVFDVYQKAINYEPQHNQACELRLFTKMGETTWVKLTYKYEVNLPKNKINISVTDLSSLRLVEDDLDLVAAVFDESKEDYIVNNADLNVIKINKTFSDITGYLEQEIIGASPQIQDLLAKIDKIAAVAAPVMKVEQEKSWRQRRFMLVQVILTVNLLRSTVLPSPAHLFKRKYLVMKRALLQMQKNVKSVV